ncbi:MAG: class I SAM-dependent methyltransferase [Candidatus Acidiferrales bacterium]
MKLGEGKKYLEKDWKRRMAYSILGEPHVPGWIRLQHVLREVERLAGGRDPIRLLDAGCNRGDLVTYLAERHPGWTFCALELDAKRIGKADKIRRSLGLTNIQYFQADICQMPFENNFDFVVCSDVLEHVENDETAVIGLTRALKPGGHLIVTTPSTPQPWHLPLVKWRERRAVIDPLESYEHVRQGYSSNEMRTLLLREGMDHSAVRYTFGRPGTLAFDLFFSIGDDKPNPVIFGAMYPVIKLLGWLDVVTTHPHGAAVLGVAQKALMQPLISTQVVKDADARQTCSKV